MGSVNAVEVLRPLISAMFVPREAQAQAEPGLRPGISRRAGGRLGRGPEDGAERIFFS